VTRSLVTRTRPHFVAQLNGKEQFIDDAKKLNALRISLGAAREASAPPPSSPAAIATAPPSLIERLHAAEEKVVTGNIVTRISTKIAEVVRQQLENAEKRLSGGAGAEG
jgi:hypothetical protein